MPATLQKPSRLKRDYLRHQATAFQRRVRTHPEWFCEHVLKTPSWPKQIELITKVFKHDKVECRGCVSSTKTYGAAMLALAWLCAHKPSRVFHLAPSFRQVDTNLWGYLRALYYKAQTEGLDIGGKIYIEPRLVLGENWYYKGFATDKPHNVHGVHGPHDLIILDDAHGIPKSIMDELENMMAGGTAHLLMLYNPVVLSGETYDCNHKDKDAWAHVKITFDDLEKARKKGYKLPGTLVKETVKKWHKKFGIRSNFCLPKIGAEYPDQETDTVIPLGWIELACMREVPDVSNTKQVWHGQDVGRFGNDESARCTIVGRRQLPIVARQGERTTTTAGRLMAAMADMGGTAAVDVIGIGSGVVDTCIAEGVKVLEVNVAEASKVRMKVKDSAKGKLKFANLRSQIWWDARESLDPENPDAIALDPMDSQLQGELSTVKWKFNNKAQIQVESKEDMKKRLGGSPDRGDAYCLAIYLRNGGSGKTRWAPIE